MQGVFFRYYTQKKAEQLGLVGNVRNLSDGSVEIKISGDESELNSFMEWCFEGSPASDVASVEVAELAEDVSFHKFDIIR